MWKISSLVLDIKSFTTCVCLFLSCCPRICPSSYFSCFQPHTVLPVFDLLSKIRIHTMDQVRMFSLQYVGIVNDTTLYLKVALDHNKPKQLVWIYLRSGWAGSGSLLHLLPLDPRFSRRRRSRWFLPDFLRPDICFTVHFPKKSPSMSIAHFLPFSNGNQTVLPVPTCLGVATFHLCTFDSRSTSSS